MAKGTQIWSSNYYIQKKPTGLIGSQEAAKTKKTGGKTRG